MADLTITAASVAKTAGTIQNGTAGATITAGQSLYLDSSAGTLKLLDADDTAATATFAGIALNGGATGQPISYLAPGGTINPGATVTVGEIYVASGTAGGIAPEGDLATGDYVTIIGVGLTSSTMYLVGYSSGVQVP